MPQLQGIVGEATLNLELKNELQNRQVCYFYACKVSSIGFLSNLLLIAYKMTTLLLFFEAGKKYGKCKPLSGRIILAGKNCLKLTQADVTLPLETVMGSHLHEDHSREVFELSPLVACGADGGEACTGTTRHRRQSTLCPQEIPTAYKPQSRLWIQC